MSYHFHVLNNPSSIQSYSTHSGDDSLPADLCTDRKVLISFYIVISSLFIIYLEQCRNTNGNASIQSTRMIEKT